MIPFEARSRKYLESLNPEDPDTAVVRSFVDTMTAHNERVRAASQAAEVVVYREEGSRHADLAADLNSVGGMLDDDILLQELRRREGWQHGRYAPQVASWAEKYMSLAPGQKATVTSMLSSILTRTDIRTVGQLRSADYEQQPERRGYSGTKVSRQSFDFGQAVFAKPEPASPKPPAR